MSWHNNIVAALVSMGEQLFVWNGVIALLQLLVSTVCRCFSGHVKNSQNKFKVNMHRYDNILMCCLVSAYSLRIFSKLSAEIVSYFVCWELEVYKIREETNSSSPLYIIWQWIPGIRSWYVSPGYLSHQPLIVGWMIVVLQYSHDEALVDLQWWPWPRTWWGGRKHRLLERLGVCDSGHCTLPQLEGFHSGLL